MNFWKWLWDNPDDKYKGEINRDTEWELLNGGQIQAWIKNELNSKYAVIRVATDEETAYLQLFSTKEDESLYDTDPELYKDRVTIVPLPAMGGQAGNDFVAMFSTTIPQNDLVVTDQNLVIPFNFRAIRFVRGIASNEGTLGTLQIQRSTDGGTQWDDVGSLSNVLRSSDPEDSTTTQDINLGQFLVNGKQLFRVRASYKYEDQGEEKIMYSTWVNIGSSITKTNLGLILKTNFEQPINSRDVNGNLQPFTVTYGVYGSVQKTLYVNIKGSTGTESLLSYDLGSEIDSIDRTISVAEDAAYGYMTHGVKKVEAWLECDNGLGETIKSSVLVNRFMVVNPDTPNADLNKPYLLLQNVDTLIDNFVQVELAEYAVYSPNGNNIDLIFLLTTYTKDYETIKPEEYFRLETSAKPNTAYSLDTTIEIEAENDADALDIYNTYFRVRRQENGKDTDFIKESTNETAYLVQVDNKNAFTPVSGATFLLNPKVRNNNESNPRRILNEKNNNSEVESVWTNFGFINDGWMTASDGQKVLRIMAGSTLEIKKDIWQQFRTNPNSSLTFEIDFQVSNVTNTTDPIVNMFGGSGGLKLNALEGWLMNGSNQNMNDCLFAWQEDKRTYLSININHQVSPNKGDVYFSEEDASKANGTIALARVLVDGDPVRELKFNTTNSGEWGTSNSIIIGNEGADIDIYSIRIYEGKQIDVVDLLNRNYKASLPTAAEKLDLTQKNNLLEGGKISLEKSKNAGLNCMVWHGILPYKNNSSEQTGWYEYFRYDDEGNYLPEFSGTNCKETKSLSNKGQGSTAKTYYDWNQQDDNSKVKATIQVALTDFHESISVRVEGNVAYIKGGNLGKNFPLEETEVEYPYANGMVTVPDGWIDGNGKYRGMGYMVAEGTALAQKKVIKINYASSMQSHLIGACTTYDLLHRKVVGATPLQQHVPTAVSAKHMEPFMFFNETNGNTYFKGMGTYGAGKADKVSWGFVKKKMPMYALIEGSDNNYPMTGFRVPFDKNTAVYSCEDEGWLYNGQQSWDFDLGNTFDLESSTDEDGYSYIMSDKYKEAPTKLIRDKWADIHNFIYLHSSNLKYYDGTFGEFRQSDEAKNINYKYWCTNDSNYNLYRWDYLESKWVNAGLLNGDDYKVVNLKTDTMTANAYINWVKGGTGDYEILNEAFIAARVAHMRKCLKFFFNEKSLQFCYCYVLSLLAGTDNSDKNTYYKIDPYVVSIPQDNEFASWFTDQYDKDFDFSAIHQVTMDGDDMDSILRTNNNSHQTKPYYIDRLHPYADDNTNECLYEGMGNQLFNFVERAYEGTHELSAVMNEIMIAATELITDEDVKNGLVGGKSLWGFFNKYFFNVQRYFPQIAYIEQARIRYEFPELLGYISSGGGARSIRPITQSLGSQLQNELQYTNQRVIYMTSYAGFGAWGGDTTHSIGLADANETFGFMPAAMPDGSAASYTFTIKPHQYIYPSFYEGQTFTQTHKRTSPKETCTFSFTQSYTSGDTGVGICGINYISDLGDFGKMSITTALVVKGKRITRIDMPTNSQFRPSSVELDTPNATYANIVTRISGGKVKVDLSKLIRVVAIVTQYGISAVVYPESSNLKELNVYGNNFNVKLENAPNLDYIILGDNNTLGMQSFHIGKNVGTNKKYSFFNAVKQIYTQQTNNNRRYLQSIHIENIDWTDVDVEMLDWLSDTQTCELYGRIGIAEGTNEYQTAVTWDLKNKFIKKFGDIDTGNGDLTLDYRKRNFEASTAKIKGSFFVDDYIVRDKGYNDVETFDFSVTPESQYMNTQTKIQFSLEGGNTSAYSMSADGKLSVNPYKLSDKQNFATIMAAVTQYENGSFVTENVTKKIEIWNRPAQVGDVVYYDGSYGSADMDCGEKTVVGICCYVAPRYPSDMDGYKKGDIVEELFDSNDIMQRLMFSANDEYNSEWGVNTGTGTNANYLNTIGSDGTRKVLTLNDTDITDTSIIDKNEEVFSGSKVSQENFVATDDLSVLNDGFIPFNADTCPGDGFAYNESASGKEGRKITGSGGLHLLISDYYKSYTGKLMNNGYLNTIKIIQHRNSLINSANDGTSNIDNFVDNNGNRINIKLFKPMKSSNKTEFESYFECKDMIHDYFKNTYQASNWDKWHLLLYPAASIAYAYEPSIANGEILAERFKAHNWFLASCGVMCRIYWIYTYTNKFARAMSLGKLNALSYVYTSSTETQKNYFNRMDFRDGYMRYQNKFYGDKVLPVCAF